MNTVTLEVCSRDAVNRRFLSALEGERQGAVISFESAELLFKVLAGKRWALLQAMIGEGPLALREIARRVDRDVKAVHGDVHTLLDAGLLEKTPDGSVLFPFDAVHVDFTLAAA